MHVKSTKKEQQAEATRAKLIATARQLFAERGYGAVGTEQIVRDAGLTRGALYHHFQGKQQLFEAVYEQLEQEVTEQVARAALSGGDIWEAFEIGWRSFLGACRDPAVRRIVLLDAPAVLGVKRFREIADRYGGALVRANIEALVEAGELEPQPVEPLSRILTGALTESAISIAESDDPEATSAEMAAAIGRLMSGMRRGYS